MDPVVGRGRGGPRAGGAADPGRRDPARARRPVRRADAETTGRGRAVGCGADLGAAPAHRNPAESVTIARTTRSTDPASPPERSRAWLDARLVAVASRLLRRRHARGLRRSRPSGPLAHPDRRRRQHRRHDGATILGLDQRRAHQARPRPAPAPLRPSSTSPAIARRRWPRPARCAHPSCLVVRAQRPRHPVVRHGEVIACDDVAVGHQAAAEHLQRAGRAARPTGRS